jgi:hypothetical protein
MTIVGGLRTRLVFDSTFNMIEDSLTSLGWFDAGRQHLPLTFISEPVREEDEVQLNTLVLTAEDGRSVPLEMGSNLSEHNRTFYVDFYAESNSLGEDLIFDVRDILEGRMTSIGRVAPTIPIYDYRTTPDPPLINTAHIEFVSVDRGVQYVKPWQRNWWSIIFLITDTYGSDS